MTRKIVILLLVPPHFSVVSNELKRETKTGKRVERKSPLEVAKGPTHFD